MVHLGNFNVAVQFVPPDGAQPGDTALLRFCNSQTCYWSAEVTIPADWTAAEKLCYTPPEIARGPRKGPSVDRPHSGTLTLERAIGIATGCIGVLGLIAGSAYVGTICPGSFGFALSFSLMLVTAGLGWIFTRWCQRAKALNEMHAGLLALTILVAAAALGAAFAQGVSNGGNTTVGLVTLMAWVATHMLFAIIGVAYMSSFTGLGPRGDAVLRSILPWLAIGASCVLVQWVAIGFLVAGSGIPWSSPLIHGIAFMLGGTTIGIGFMAQQRASMTPGTESQEVPDCHIDRTILAVVPSLLTSLVVTCMCVLCIQDATSTEGEPLGAVIRRSVYASGFLVTLAFSQRYFLQAACVLALAALICATLDTFAAERWIVVLCASCALQWHMRLRARGGNSEDEPPNSNTGTDAIVSEEDIEMERPSPGGTLKELCDNIGSMVFDNLEDVLRLAGALFLSSIATMRMVTTERHGTLTVWMPLSMIVPVCILVSFVGSRPSVECDHLSTLQIALFGFVIAALPYRIMLNGLQVTPYSHIAPATHEHEHDRLQVEATMVDWTYEISLLVYPLALIGICRLRKKVSAVTPKGKTMLTQLLLMTALCLLCLERISPVGLVIFGAVAFTLALKQASFATLVSTILVWECRGFLSVTTPIDSDLVLPEVLAFIIGVVTSAIVIICFALDKQLYAPLLLTAIPVPFYLAPLTHGLACLVAAFCFLCCAAMQSHDVTSIVGPIIVLVAVSIAHDCNAYGHSDLCWPSWLPVTQLGSAAASLSALLLAILANIRKESHCSAVAWVLALLLSVGGNENNGPLNWLTVFQVGCLTCVVILFRLPWLYVWYTLPGLWAIVIWQHTTMANAMLAPLGVGAVFMLVPLAASKFPMYSTFDPKDIASFEPIGMAWVTVGAWLGLYFQGVLGSITAITMLVILGASQLLLGLAGAKRAKWRRVGGLLDISFGIFLGAGATEGIVQALLVFIGSLVAIAMAVLVFYAPSEDSAEEAAEDSESRAVFLPEQNPIE